MSQPAAAIEPAVMGPENPEPGERVYFPELDGMRFIAFLLVYLFHRGVPWALLTRSFQSLADAVNYCLSSTGVSWRRLSNEAGRTVTLRLQENGGFGVQLFFILSGYLITTLLLREEARYGRIALRAFWIRRILRIWPLYYLVVVIGFFVLPPFQSPISVPDYLSMLRIHLVPFALFLGNWSMVLINPIPSDSLSVLWSVCVEEQFYLIVPLFIALVLPRFRIPLVGFLLVASIAVRSWNASRSGSPLAIVYNTFAQFDTLCSGVLLALVMGWNRDRPMLARWLRYLQWPHLCGDPVALQPAETRPGNRLAPHVGLRLGVDVRCRRSSWWRSGARAGCARRFPIHELSGWARSATDFTCTTKLRSGCESGSCTGRRGSPTGTSSSRSPPLRS